MGEDHVARLGRARRRFLTSIEPLDRAHVNYKLRAAPDADVLVCYPRPALPGAGSTAAGGVVVVVVVLSSR